MKRFITVIIALLIFASSAMCEGAETFGITKEDFIRQLIANVDSTLLIPTYANRVNGNEERFTGYFTLKTITDAVIQDGYVKQISITGGGEGSDNMEALLVFASCAMVVDPYAKDIDSALGYVLRAINQQEYTNRKRTVRYQVSFDYMKGYTLTFLPGAMVQD